MPRLIVAGCGYLGLATARLFHSARWDVLGLTHSAESAAQLSGESFRVAAADISDEASLRALGDERAADLIIHCASSGRGGPEAYEAVYLRGSRNLMALLAPRQLIFTSSTSVYAQTGGEIVTEQSAAEPQRETGRILRETEDLVLAKSGVVARLAGLYGPCRSVLLSRFLSGEAVVEAGGNRIINQIHRADAASAFLILATAEAHGIYNVLDDTPLTQIEVYRALAAHFGKAMPPEGPMDVNRKRGWTSKRVSNAKLRALGWKPRYPSFLVALKEDPELVEEARS